MKPLRVRPRGWLLIKIAVFVATFLAVWLLRAPVANAAPPDTLASASAEPESDQLDRLSYFDLSRAVAGLWKSRPGASDSGPPIDAKWVKVRIYDLSLAVAARLGDCEDPRRRLDAISAEIFQRRGFRVLTPREGGADPSSRLLDDVVVRRAGLPLPLALLYACVAELLAPPLRLAVAAGPYGALVLFEDGNTSFTVAVAPEHPGVLLRGEDLRRFVGRGPGGRSAEPIQRLSKAQLGGSLLGDLSRAALDDEDSDAARFLASKAVELSPDQAQLWFLLSEIGEAVGDPALERSALDAALKAEPNHTPSLVRRGRLLHQSGALDDADLDYRKALSLGAEAATAVYRALGDLERDRGQLQRAIEAYRSCLSGAPAPQERERVMAEIREIELRPAIEALRGSASYSARFEALRDVARSPSERGVEALVHSLRDPNRRFARLVWQRLREMTGQELQFDALSWETWWANRPRDGLLASGSAGTLQSEPRP